MVRRKGPRPNGGIAGTLSIARRKWAYNAIGVDSITLEDTFKPSYKVSSYGSMSHEFPKPLAGGSQSFVCHSLVPDSDTRYHKPWFFDEKENKFFVQTGAGSRNVNEQPYTGPSKDFDRLMAPIDVFRKRQDSELQVDVGDGQAIKFSESDFWKTTEIIDEGANDEIAAVAVQEFKLDTSNLGVDAEPAKAEFEDDAVPKEDSSSDNPSDSPIEEETVNSKPVCQGKQVTGDCVAGKLPNRGDFAGQYGPICMKADGEEGSRPRLNEQELNKAATTYCQGMKLEDCVTLLSQSFSLTCDIGESWANYNNGLQVMGGVLAKDYLI
ncbi:hypothetical protein FSPOR_1823 [Fusarium sporotrichioides]|uniref:Uncharacterized protein n=1 Tax=Fusarium sporotrichioides TaxID=5514 RepID=A0A395SNU3_FUSSP|nr:hypothetical protein FSPOR_1823 [Fusarium sporotrichioides]